MAGSNRFFAYVDDLGELWAVNRDESATEEVNGTAAAVTPASGTPILTGKGHIEPRYLNYNSSDGLYRRKIIFLSNTTAALASAPVSITLDAEGGTIALQLTSYVGERRRYVPNSDTRQTDGDTEVVGGGT